MFIIGAKGVNLMGDKNPKKKPKQPKKP